ncbi:hypothetical protein ACFFU8_09245 [Chromobacterium piscinae]|uniref:hypothetical protein n=1 Tax=Chromobacterium piscinae TaxID=686831 RepID=UPI001E488057|nr:hypothetical protein [Chromobacterium piscinae]MCD5327911.1 hypothetical protein [Chromobacterium piscinae]
MESRQDNRMLAMAMAALLAAALYNGGDLTHQALARKADGQQAATQRLAQWQAQYKELAPSQVRWKNTFAPADDVKDQYRLIQLLNIQQYGLQMPMDSFTVNDIKPIEFNGQKLGLYKVCIGNTGGNQLNFVAQDYQTLLAAAKQLAQRQDLRLDKLTVQAGTAPTMVVYNACLLVRS